MVIHVEENELELVLKTRGCTMYGSEYITSPASYPSIPYEKSIRILVRDCTYPTEIIVTPLQNLKEALPYYPKINEILTRSDAKLVTKPSRPERVFPGYNTVMFCKMIWLKDSALQNPFNSTYFFWMDGGYGKGQYFHPRAFKENRWPDLEKVQKWIDPQRYFVIRIRRDLDREYCNNPRIAAKEHHTATAGGFHGGTLSSILEYHSLFYSTLQATFSTNIMDDDELIHTLSWCMRPDLISLHRCINRSYLEQNICAFTKDAVCHGKYHCVIHLLLAS